MPIQQLIGVYLFLRKITIYFLQDIMREVDSHTEQIKIRFVLQLCLLFLVFTSLVSYTIFLISPYAFFAITIFWLINIATPFIIKYTNSVYFPAKIFLFAAFICSAHIHVVVGIPEGLGPVLWYLIIVLSASFILGKRWGLFYILLSVGMIGLLNTTTYLEVPLFGMNEQKGLNRLLMLPLRIGVPMIFLYIVIREFIAGKELAEEKSQQLISHQKTLTNKIADRELAYRNLVEEVEDVIYEVDRIGNFIFINNAGVNTLGYSKKELLKMSIYDFIVPEDQKVVRQFYRMQMKKNINSTYHQIQIQTKLGERIWVGQRTKMIFDEKGRLLKSLCVGRNISVQKEIDVMLEKAKDEAVQQNKMKTNFMSAMSHELKTPLNAVVALGHGLLEDDLNPEQKKDVETILFSANNLVGIVNDLLDYNLIEAGQVKLKRMPFDLMETVAKAVHLNRQLIKNKEVTIRWDSSTVTSSKLIGDKGRLVQILTNLLRNATKFTRKGAIDLLIKQTSETDKWVDLYFEVKDTGIGIEASKLDHIFERFTQIDSTLSRKYGGTGLGLSIVKQLLQQMGSNIQVKSELGKGSSFFFTLKFPKQKELVKENKKEYNILKRGDLSGLQVLLVEDNKINQLVTKKILTKWNTKVDIAENGQIGVDKFKQNHYDLILMDLEMPVLNGFDATQQIRAIEDADCSIPIIAVTASAVTDIVCQLENHQFTDLVMKPFEPKELYSKMLKYCAETNEVV